MEIYNEIIIERPVEEVFTFLSNFENMSKWNYYVLSVKKTTDGPVTKGSTFHQIRKDDAQDLKVTEFKFPETVAIETLISGRRLTMQFKISHAGSYTRIEDVWQLEASWIAGVFIKRRIKTAVYDNLKKLKTLMEQGTVTLQDGRMIRLEDWKM